MAFTKSQAQVELVATGAVNNFAVTYPAAIVSLPAGMEFTFKAHLANSSAAFLNLNGLGLVEIVKNSNLSLSPNDIKAGHFVRVIYDGSKWQMLSTSANPSTGTIGGGGTVNGVAFFSNNSAITADGTNFLWDNTNKRLGIGTTTPVSTLVVEKNTNITDGISGTFLDITNSQTALNILSGIRFKSYGVANGYSKGAIFFNNTSGGGGNGIGDIVFANNNIADATNANMTNAVMILKPGGNVGIGTTSPTSNLDVAGSVRIQSLTGPGLVSADASGNLGISSGTYVQSAATANRVPYMLNAINMSNSPIQTDGSWTSIGAAPSTNFLFRVESSNNFPAVYGTSNVAGGNGVWGYNSNNTGAGSGVRGVAIGDGYGVYGQLSSPTSGAAGYFDAGGTGVAGYFNGRVGIGTVSPDAQFQINGGNNFAQFVINANNVNNAAIELRSTDGTTNEYIDFTRSSTSTFGNGSPNFDHRILSDGPVFSILHSSGQRIVFENGNMGIGVSSSPLNKLHVQGGARITNLSASGAVFADANGNLLVSTSSGANAWTINGTNIIPQNLTNNVGIGTNAPNSRLHIVQEGSNATIRLQTNHDPAPNGSDFILARARGSTTSPTLLASDDRIGSVIFQGYDGGAYAAGASIESKTSEVWASGTKRGANIIFNTVNLSSTIPTEKMRITANGNVGIGTTVPGAKLSISNGLDEATNYGQALQITNATTIRQQIAFISGSNRISAGYNGASDIWGFGASNSVDASFTPSYLSIKQSNGNVGIGTFLAQNRLDVLGNMAIGAYAGVNAAPANGLIVSGNVGIGTTVPGTKLDVVGTVNVQSGKITKDGIDWLDGIPPSRNYFIGQAGNLSMTGSDNFFVGSFAGNALNSGYANAFIGSMAGRLTNSGYSNLFVGTQAGFNNTTGNRNIFIGEKAGFSNTTSSRNNFLGQEAGFSNLIGSHNNYFGWQAGYFNTGGFNIFMGAQSGYGVSGVSTGQYNAGLGSAALYSLTSGVENVGIGHNAGFSATSGSYNILVGSYAGSNLTTGNNNIAIGSDAGNSIGAISDNIAIGNHADVGSAATNAIAIGKNAVATNSNTMVLGGTGTNAVSVGIGIAAPASTLHVNGSFQGKITTSTTNYTVLLADFIVSKTGTAAVTFTLPAPGTSLIGKIYHLLNANATGVITITATGNVGATSVPISSGRTCICISATQWHCW
ncbi:MAG: hypothetical protein EAZ27_11225 [Cytophagales bacterium]|nr:MAG: hypothetical protein EAZ27_11225 [Cytophagales bacterium]